jgi:hypothetical protein
MQYAPAGTQLGYIQLVYTQHGLSLITNWEKKLLDLLNEHEAKLKFLPHFQSNIFHIIDKFIIYNPAKYSPMKNHETEIIPQIFYFLRITAKI